VAGTRGPRETDYGLQITDYEESRNRGGVGLFRRRTRAVTALASARRAERRHLAPIRRADRGAGLPQIRPLSAGQRAAVQRAESGTAGQTGEPRLPGPAAWRGRRVRRAAPAVGLPGD